MSCTPSFDFLVTLKQLLKQYCKASIHNCMVKLCRFWVNCNSENKCYWYYSENFVVYTIIKLTDKVCVSLMPVSLFLVWSFKNIYCYTRLIIIFILALNYSICRYNYRMLKSWSNHHKELFHLFYFVHFM